jgi:hypothetical protein
MNYSAPSSSILIDQPFNNPLTKIACGIGLVYVGYMGIKYATKEEPSPHNRRARQGFTTSKVDQAIDHKNKVSGHPVPSNPLVPHYSRHNQNRRRRSPILW